MALKRAARRKSEARPATPVLRHENRRAEKFRNLSPAELAHQQREIQDQLFRLKFQLKMGQTESLKKIQELRRNLARVKTIQRARELGLESVGTEKR
ncbi:MAG TPA: 50S ribosomal protein L29 [Terriglobales bacterium]|nr:50S ribosomal protein L29 [Terriglobales bacterium]